MKAQYLHIKITDVSDKIFWLLDWKIHCVVVVIVTDVSDVPISTVKNDG
jgi:hypothetical protein